jgi:hypothetical protein
LVTKRVSVPDHDAPLVFLSHSSKDSDWVDWMQKHAAALGVNLYLAEHEHRAGENLGEKVLSAIDRCIAMIVLLTSNQLAARVEPP